jgi:hypothetical protein
MTIQHDTPRATTNHPNAPTKPDTTLRRLIIEALTHHITTHGEISDDPDDINTAAQAIWDALGISGTTTPHISDEANEPRLHQVVADICENCLNGTPGQCHVPGCLFIRFHIEDTPQPLKYLVQTLDDLRAALRGQLVTLITEAFDKPWSTVRTQAADPDQLADIALGVILGPGYRQAVTQ